jgi:hypothetical protein
MCLTSMDMVIAGQRELLAWYGSGATDELQ